MKIEQHPVPTNTVEVSSKGTSWVKLLTSNSAQKELSIPRYKQPLPMSEVKGCYLKKETWSHANLSRPRCSSTSSSVDRRKQRQERSGHSSTRDIGDVHSSSTAEKKGSSYQQWRIIQSALGHTTTTTHLREFASMTHDLQLEITMNLAINGSPFMIGWGQG
jgi:hypothetical protein